MSEQKWTKEPWEFHPEHGQVWAKNDKEHPRYEVGCDISLALFESWDGVPGPDAADANGQRAVACVNALQGIPDPAAWVEAAKKAIDSAQRVYDSLEQPEHCKGDDRFRFRRTCHEALDPDAECGIKMGEAGVQELGEALEALTTLRKAEGR